MHLNIDSLKKENQITGLRKLRKNMEVVNV